MGYYSKNLNAFKKDIAKLKELSIKQMDVDSFMELDESTLELMQVAFRLCNTSMRMLEEQMGMSMEINHKLDKLLTNFE